VSNHLLWAVPHPSTMMDGHLWNHKSKSIFSPLSCFCCVFCQMMKMLPHTGYPAISPVLFQDLSGPGLPSNDYLAVCRGQNALPSGLSVWFPLCKEPITNMGSGNCDTMRLSRWHIGALFA
jgi:hypothetical protein